MQSIDEKEFYTYLINQFLKDTTAANNRCITSKYAYFLMQQFSNKKTCNFLLRKSN